MVDVDWTSSDQLAALMNDFSVRIFSFNFRLEQMPCHPNVAGQMLRDPNKSLLENLLNVLHGSHPSDWPAEMEGNFGRFGLRFWMILRAALEGRWDRIDQWHLGGMGTPEKVRIAQNVEAKLSRLSTIMKVHKSDDEIARNERRLAQLFTIFGKGEKALPMLLGSNCQQANFMENSLRGLVQVMLTDDSEKVCKDNIKQDYIQVPNGVNV